jgi:hypothetical protein
MNKLGLLLFFCINFFCAVLHAQDTIVKMNHEKVLAKVQEVGIESIKYKRYNSPDGPVYILAKREINRIIYADGTVEIFTNSSYSNSAILNSTIQQRPWAVHVNLFDLALSVFSTEIEYNCKSKLSFRVPGSFGLGARLHSGIMAQYYSKNKIVSTGLKVLYSPFGKQNRIHYYTGLSGEFCLTKAYGYNYEWPVFYYAGREIRTVGLGLLNGVQFQMNDRLVLGSELTLGTMYSIENQYFQPLARFALNMGIRFGKLKT